MCICAYVRGLCAVMVGAYVRLTWCGMCMYAVGAQHSMVCRRTVREMASSTRAREGCLGTPVG